MYNPFSISDKSILITGAGGGIGRATAVECAKMGANVLITDINENSLSETLPMLDTSEGQSHQMFVADLTDESQQAELVKNLPELDGRHIQGVAHPVSEYSGYGQNNGR